ncbi:hypothetical protein M5X06_12615 [Paenibacillus alvei]|uniref:Uncharacterized protein n=2 Tax=Paenibacillus alvei TaxID=44250 RepID=A0ABT4EGR1_PAEAL|nr:hypothetical protein [Paenibacillus alvei]MCY9532914.1 hypothetical protein [Paenibacillus alvei]MCY9760362.1 hypothetical protein [Paenibacillus alvei]MCY9767654.1 hypothetical protein [Paenibacillus alvei]
MAMTRVKAVLTHEQIIEKWDEMTPRERDAWVAEVVYGWDNGMLNDARIAQAYGFDGGMPYYTTNIYTAELVLAKIPGEVYIYRKTTGDFVVSFGYSDEGCPECGEEPFEVLAQGKAPTLSEAICLAALIAKLSESSV